MNKELLRFTYPVADSEYAESVLDGVQDVVNEHAAAGLVRSVAFTHNTKRKFCLHRCEGGTIDTGSGVLCCLDVQCICVAGMPEYIVSPGIIARWMKA